MKKHFFFVFHSHIPYVVGHGTWPHGMNWLHEVAAESYLPLLQMFLRLSEKGLKELSVISITPVLMEQLESSAFKKAFIEYLSSRIEAAKEDKKYFSKANESEMLKTALFWEEFYTDKMDFFKKINKDIVGAFRKLQEEGVIEIITSAATHGYLPLIKYDEDVYAQIVEGVKTYRRYFGCEPKGFWLPECAYRPAYVWEPPIGKKESFERSGLEEFLSMTGISYFFVDTHLLRGGNPIGTYINRFEALRLLWEKFATDYEEKRELSPYTSYLVSSSDVAFYTRDPVTALQVWSGKHGYPGDPAYLEFHKKRFPSGLRYWRVTGEDVNLGTKAPYKIEDVESVLYRQSSHFISLLEETLSLSENNVVVAMYDTELFGHWWFEGVRWLEKVYEGIYKHPFIDTITGGSYIEKHPPTERVLLPEGSWGEGGFHYVWLNESTSWMWERIYDAEDTCKKIIGMQNKIDKDSRATEILKQLLRELLLIESSDWPFLVTTWSARDYGENRVAYHYDNIKALSSILQDFLVSGEITNKDWSVYQEINLKDPVFQNISPASWSMRRGVIP